MDVSYSSVSFHVAISEKNCTSPFHHFDWNYIPYVMCFGSTYLAKENKLILAMLRGVRSITDVSI